MKDPIAVGAERLALFFLVAFASLALVTFYWGFIEADKLGARPDNLRRISFDLRIARGRILDRSGRVLAETLHEADPEAEDPRAAEASRRVYAYPAAAPVIGFQTWRYGAGGDTRVTYGIGGAEAAYDRALRGDLGLSMRQLLASRVLHRAQQGNDIVITLDADLQAYAAELIGDREGAAVVLDVESGAIRALVSLPTFDPTDLDRGLTADDGRSPLLNRATQGLYPPGSVWKVVTLAAALDQGIAKPDTIYDDGEGEDRFEGFAVACNNNPAGSTRFDLAHAFGWSCNRTFARLGVALGEPTYRAYARRFGLGFAPPFSLPTVAGQLSGNERMSVPELASAAFGQGEILVSPLHMALIAAASAGSGRLPVPYLLDDVPGLRWSSLADDRGTWLTPLPRDVAEALREIMLVSARDGHARTAAATAGIAIGGKTGTAQLGGEQAPHSWFIGFAPAEAPRLAVAVLVVNGGEGGAVAAPIGGYLLARGLKSESASTE